MGIFDRFKRGKDQGGGNAAALMDRARGMMHSHSDQVDKGVDKAGQVIDDRTGHKYTDQINTGASKAKEMLAEDGGQSSGRVGAPGPEAGSDPDTPRPDGSGKPSGEQPLQS